MKSKKSSIGNWILFVFGLVFFLVGMGVGYSTIGTMTIKYFSSSNWQPVSANISSLSLKKSHGESTTYKVEAKYSYFYNGDRQSSNVTFSNTSDNIGDYWQELHKRLKQDRANGTVQAWVNPSNPDEAILDRTFRWAQVAFGSIFIFMFGGFGLGAMWLSMAKAKPREQQRREDRANGISSKEKSGFWILFLFGSPFFLIGLFTFFLALPDITNNGDYAALFTLLFVFVGAGIMIFAYINNRRYKLIGPTPLFLDPLPGIIGGQVGGTFDVAFRSQNTPVTIVLSCKKRVKRGKNTSTKIIWQESMQGYVKQKIRGMSVSFLFDCPDNLPDSGSRGVFWEVRAESNLQMQANGIKFERNWSIPVEKGGTIASSVDIPESFFAQQSERKAQLAQDSAADLINFKQHGRFLDLVNISERSMGNFFGGLVFGLIFVGSGVFTTMQNWWPGYIFMFVGALVIYGSLFVLGRSVDVRVDTAARILYTRRKWFGIVLYKREVMLFDPSQFSLKQTSSTTTNKDLTRWFKVEVKNDEKQVLIAEAIKGKEVAQALMDKIIEKTFPQRYRP